MAIWDAQFDILSTHSLDLAATEEMMNSKNNFTRRMRNLHHYFHSTRIVSQFEARRKWECTNQSRDSWVEIDDDWLHWVISSPQNKSGKAYIFRGEKKRVSHVFFLTSSLTQYRIEVMSRLVESSTSHARVVESALAMLKLFKLTFARQSSLNLDMFLWYWAIVSIQLRFELVSPIVSQFVIDEARSSKVESNLNIWSLNDSSQMLKLCNLCIM